MFRIYHGNGKHKDVVIYKGLKLSFLVRMNLNLMPNNIVKLNEKNFMSTVQTNFGKTMLILFTERKESSLLYRSMANLYSNQVVFCEVQKSDPFIKKFNVSKFPSLMILNDPTNFTGIMFDEKISKGNILNFINQNAKQKKEEKVMELNADLLKMGNCGKKDKNICVVAVTRQS